MKLNVYVDGFNLYYNCVKDRGPGYHWVDLLKLCQAEFPGHDINRIRFFTAWVKVRPEDPRQQARQNAYVRALCTIPQLTVHFGKFRKDARPMELVHPLPNLPSEVEVWDVQEKGSDVNLATYLLLDSFRNECDMAVVVSNDSDLVEPIRVLQSEFGTAVTILHPCRRKEMRSAQLKAAVPDNRSRVLQDHLMPACQFPNSLKDDRGREIHKPAEW